MHIDIFIYTQISSREAFEIVVIPNVVLIIASNASTSGFICIGVIRGDYIHMYYEQSVQYSVGLFSNFARILQSWYCKYIHSLNNFTSLGVGFLVVLVSALEYNSWYLFLVINLQIFFSTAAGLPKWLLCVTSWRHKSNLGTNISLRGYH